MTTKSPAAGSSENLPAVQQQTLKDTFDQIKKALATMDKAKNQPPLTNGQFKYSPASKEAIEISKTSDLKQIIAIAGFIKTKQNEYENGLIALDLQNATVPVFEWLGFTAEAWFTDLKIRSAIVTEEATRKELEDTAKELSSFFSREMQLEGVLAKAAAIAGKLG